MSYCLLCWNHGSKTIFWIPKICLRLQFCFDIRRGSHHFWVKSHPARFCCWISFHFSFVIYKTNVKTVMSKQKWFLTCSALPSVHGRQNFMVGKYCQIIFVWLSQRQIVFVRPIKDFFAQLSDHQHKFVAKLKKHPGTIVFHFDVWLFTKPNTMAYRLVLLCNL